MVFRPLYLRSSNSARTLDDGERVRCQACLIAPLDGVGLDREIPFAERHVTVQASGNGLIVGLGDSHTRFLYLLGEMNHRVNSTPSHGSCPGQRGFHGRQQGAIPVVLEDSPTAFDRVVLAVIGWVVRQS